MSVKVILKKGKENLTKSSLSIKEFNKLFKVDCKTTVATNNHFTKVIYKKVFLNAQNVKIVKLDMLLLSEKNK